MTTIFTRLPELSVSIEARKYNIKRRDRPCIHDAVFQYILYLCRVSDLNDKICAVGEKELVSRKAVS